MKRALGAFFLSLLILVSARSTLAARGETPAAFDVRCIPSGGVAPPSHTPGMLGRRAWPAGRIARLGATRAFRHGLLTHDPITTKVTFAREISAIMAARCARCHVKGGSAPMALTTYEDVRPWARAIKEQVLTRRMPKWHAARGFGAFKADPSLTPLEMAVIVSWVDGGLPRGVTIGAEGAKGALGAKGAGAKGATGAKGAVSAIVAAGASEGVMRGRSRWVSAWSFEPGDPLITSATVTSDGGVVGTWVAGDGEVRMPAGTAIRVWGRVRVRLQRRAAADYEQLFTAKPSVLRFTARAGPVRRVWNERIECGAPRTGRAAELLAVRPLLAEGGSARLWLERTGATNTILAWFRDFEPGYARTYWLARPADFGPDPRLQSDTACAAELTLVSLPQRR